MTSHGPPVQTGPPYRPTEQALGGTPSLIPDVPITVIFLFFYVILAPVNMVILKKNEKRGHKFVFNGALFGFCVIRIGTMSLRIAWSLHKTNISLAIAANVFVYVGTIIIYLLNWFFTQRVIRAQHPHWGWSVPYRILHRAGIFFLIATLLMIIVGAIQQFFTLDPYTLKIDSDLRLTGQTYFAAFSIAPLVLLAISLILPRKRTEKFGAGRLRNNIAILIIAICIIACGQIYRTVVNWLPSVALRNARGQPIPTPWYFSKACFYVFNFLTELLVVILFVITRVDLRFHIPNGSKKAGDYSAGREDHYHVGVIGDEKKLKRKSTLGGGPYEEPSNNNSNDTLHMYPASLFDDTRTLADSLRYPSSILEVDSKTGNWKIKRVSRDASSVHSARMSHMSDGTTWHPDRETMMDAPPVPRIPAESEWPLRDSQQPRSSGVPIYTTHNRRSMSANGTGLSSQRSNEIEGHWANGVDMSDAIADAINKLEANSEANQYKQRADYINKSAPPDYNALTPVERRPGSDLPKKHTYMPQAKSRAGSSHGSKPVSRHGDGAASRGNTSFDTAEEEFRRFSFEAPPRQGEEGYEGSLNESERSLERGHSNGSERR